MNNESRNQSKKAEGNAPQILTQLLNKGAKRVRTNDGVEFMLSVRTDSTGCVIGIAPFALGGKCPRHGKHMMLPAFAREDYFSQLQLVEVA